MVFSKNILCHQVLTIHTIPTAELTPSYEIRQMKNFLSYKCIFLFLHFHLRMCDKHRYTWMSAHWRWITLGWCQLIALWDWPAAHSLTFYRVFQCWYVQNHVFTLYCDLPQQLPGASQIASPGWLQTDHRPLATCVAHRQPLTRIFAMLGQGVITS